MREGSLPALVVRLQEIQTDLSGEASQRGARKLLVTQVRSGKEREAESLDWTAPGPGAACEVLETQNLEIAVFDQTAAQQRHRHEFATEIYLVLAGRMEIEVEGDDHLLNCGDFIVVAPNSRHEVKVDGTEFLCQLISANCRGEADKHLC
ncbi:MAG: cupin domain-containing protein [Deltaproteobacteria bacterium]|nr:cupin domain-containing protein [Deltaproteobacteria bacterium]